MWSDKCVSLTGYLKSPHSSCCGISFSYTKADDNMKNDETVADTTTDNTDEPDTDLSWTPLMEHISFLHISY